MMYQMLSEAMNVLMTMNTQLYKYLFENLVGGDSADRSKPLFKKASTSGPNARIADDPTNENKKESEFAIRVDNIRKSILVIWHLPINAKILLPDSGTGTSLHTFAFRFLHSQTNHLSHCVLCS